jgi:hypothetical protein
MATRQDELDLDHAESAEAHAGRNGGKPKGTLAVMRMDGEPLTHDAAFRELVDVVIEQNGIGVVSVPGEAEGSVVPVYVISQERLQKFQVAVEFAARMVHARDSVPKAS